MNKFNLQGKLFLVLRDNAANMNCAMRDHYESLGCISHTLQLVIKNALFQNIETKETLKKCRKIVGHFHHSEPATRKLTECQNQCGVSNHALVQDVEVRWNSTYMMMERLLEQKNAINLYSVEHGKIETLSSEEWANVKHLTNVLKFFYEATLQLSFDDACISIIIPLISLLNRKLQIRWEAENENQIISKMKNALHESLNSRFSFVKGHPLLLAATLLDPRFKSKYLTADDVNIATTEIIEFLIDQNGNRRSERIENANSSPENLPALNEQSPIEKESLWDTHDQTSSNPVQTETVEDHTSILKQTINCYLSETILQRNADIYSYWNSSPYPTLRKAVLKYLSAPPTSVPSEQLFSAAGQIYSDRRSNLLGENVEKLLFLAYNIGLFS